MKILRSTIALCAAALLVCSCQQKSANETSEPLTHVLHANDVDPLSPDSVIAILKEGNDRFVQKQGMVRDQFEMMKESAVDGQHPLAIVLSCIDARVPVETIFDKGLGDIFVTRVAGNVVSPDVLGSMEYACEHTGSKVVVVLGHENCGAVASACADVQAGNMTQMLAKIKPAIDELGDSIDHASAEFQNMVVSLNVDNMVNRVREESAILKELEEEGKIKIVGAVFNLHTGVVEFK
ncbi:MAG: carbonic anhydrase [Bacteroidales bacterium]|nr:carbonic anhydrase [Bacteroidales bacterium]